MNLTNLELYCYLQYKVKKKKQTNTPVVHKCKYLLVNAVEFPQCTNPRSLVNRAQALPRQDPTSNGYWQAATSFPLANIVYSIWYLTPLITKYILLLLTSSFQTAVFCCSGFVVLTERAVSTR